MVYSSNVTIDIYLLLLLYLGKLQKCQIDWLRIDSYTMFYDFSKMKKILNSISLKYIDDHNATHP